MLVGGSRPELWGGYGAEMIPRLGRTPLQAWHVVVAGLLAGLTSGLFGVGGGVVMVPALVLLANYPHKLAIGTSLTAIIPISLAATLGYAAAGEVEWVYVIVIVLGAMTGAVIGTRYLRKASAPALQLAFAALIVITAVRLVWGGETDGLGTSDITVSVVSGLVLVGLASGVLAGLFGVGGGVIIVPALAIAFGAPMVAAKGTSLAVIIPTAVLGTWRNQRAGLTEIGPGLVMGVAGVVSALAAVRLSLVLDETISAWLFAGLLVFMAARMVTTARTELAGDRSPPSERSASTEADSPTDRS